MTGSRIFDGQHIEFLQEGVKELSGMLKVPPLGRIDRFAQAQHNVL